MTTDPVLKKLLELGLPIIPLCSPDHKGMPPWHLKVCTTKSNRGKVPLLKGWQEHALTSLQDMEQWGREWPGHGYGLLMGGVSGIVGVDVDNPKAEVYLTKHGTPASWEFNTGKGRRILYDVPKDAVYKKKIPVDGLELLGSGQQSAIPPTIHHTGRKYEWKPGCSPLEREIAPAPDWIVRLMTEGTRPRETRSPEQGDIEPADPGAVEDFLTWPCVERLLKEGCGEGKRYDGGRTLAAGLFERKMPEAEIRKIIHGYLSRCTPPKTDDLDHVITSGRDMAHKGLHFSCQYQREREFCAEGDRDKCPRIRKARTGLANDVFEDGVFKVTVASATLTKDGNVKAMIKLYHEGRRVDAGNINFSSHELRKRFYKGVPKEDRVRCERFLIDVGERLEKYLRSAPVKVEIAKAKPNERLLLKPMGDHEPWKDDVLAEARTMTYDEAKKRIALLIRFSKSSDYDSYLLSLSQTYILDFLVKVWYEVFIGPKSTGKTTATKIWAYLARDTYHVGVFTAAAIVTVMDRGRGVTLDEVDKALRREERPLVEALLCQGIERDQPYVKLVETTSEDGQRVFMPTAVPTFGPKALNFARKIDDMLLSRADPIRMSRAHDPAMRRRARRYRKHMAPVKAWLEMEAEKALAAWTPDKVEEYEESEEYVRLSDALHTELPRTGEIGDLMLIVGHIMGWPVETIIQERLDEIGEHTTEDVTEEIVDIILRQLNTTDKQKDGFWRIKTSEIRKEFKKLFEAQMPHAGEKFTDNDYRAMLDDLDLKRDRDWTEKKGPTVLVISDNDKACLESRTARPGREKPAARVGTNHRPPTDPHDGGVCGNSQQRKITDTTDTTGGGEGEVSPPSSSKTAENTDADGLDGAATASGSPLSNVSNVVIEGSVVTPPTPVVPVVCVEHESLAMDHRPPKTVVCGRPVVSAPTQPSQLPKHSEIASTPQNPDPKFPPKPLPRNVDGRLTDEEGVLIETTLDALRVRVKDHGNDADDLKAAIDRIVAIADEGRRPSVNELYQDLPACRDLLETFGGEIVPLAKMIRQYREHRKNNGEAPR